MIKRILSLSAIGFLLLCVVVISATANDLIIYSEPVRADVVECGVYVGTLPVIRMPPVNGRCEWDITNMPVGTHVVKMTAFDATGKESAKSPDTVTIRRVDYLTFVRYYKSISYKCVKTATGTICTKE